MRAVGALTMLLSLLSQCQVVTSAKTPPGTTKPAASLCLSFFVIADQECMLAHSQTLWRTGGDHCRRPREYEEASSPACNYVACSCTHCSLRRRGKTALRCFLVHRKHPHRVDRLHSHAFWCAGEVIAEGKDCTSRHPLHHAIMVAIELAAARDRQLWPSRSTAAHNAGSVTTKAPLDHAAQSMAREASGNRCASSVTTQARFYKV